MSPDLLLRRSYDLAHLGSASNKTNPIVGAALTDEGGTILSEGYYEQFGGPHAEVACLDSYRTGIHSSDLLAVSLEPCNIHGKTPPCSALIQKHGIKNLLIGETDPNPAIAGSSLRELDDHGVNIQQLNSPRGLALLRQFRVNTLQKRPYIILKWAESSDGFLGIKTKRVKLSNWASNRLVHKWRSEADAILVGTQTAITDDPQLTSRHFGGPAPMRILLDRFGKVDSASHLFDGSVPTQVWGRVRSDIMEQNVSFSSYSSWSEFPKKIQALYGIHIGTLFIEGGAKILKYCLESNLWDECRIIRTPLALDDGIRAPEKPGTPDEDLQLLDDHVMCFLNDSQER